MYCADCGTDLGGVQAIACPQCGCEPRVDGGTVVGELGRRLGISSRDAAGTLRSLAIDPVGSLAPVFRSLGAERAGAAGLVLCVVAAGTAALGVALGTRRLLGAWSGIIGIDGVGIFFKSFLGLLVLSTALTVAGLVVRKVVRGTGSGIAGDVFTAGASLVPLGLATLLGGLLGAANVEIAALLYLFGLSHLVLILFAGLTGLGGLSTRAAALSVPFMLVLTAWLSKIVFAALL